MMIINSIEYPKMFHSLAEEMALLRTKLSKDVYHKDSDKFRGTDEHRISTLGILGELIARHSLEEQGLEYKAAPLVDIKPVVEPDIVMPNKTIDVKCVRYSNKIFRINADAHENKSKRPTIYWFIQPDIKNLVAGSYYFDAVDIDDEWEKVRSTYTEVYEFNKNKIQDYKRGLPDVLQWQTWMDK